MIKIHWYQANYLKFVELKCLVINLFLKILHQLELRFNTKIVKEKRLYSEKENSLLMLRWVNCKFKTMTSWWILDLIFTLTNSKESYLWLRKERVALISMLNKDQQSNKKSLDLEAVLMQLIISICISLICLLKRVDRLIKII